MSRLKHPVRAIREPFGTAGLIIACVALVAALGGTALAASKLNGTQKKEVEKIAKKFAGKPGAAGAQGSPGTNGTNGAAGKDGTNGSNGNPGAAGTNGTFSTEPLPSEQTLTGSWAVAGPEGYPLAQISFPIEVSPAPTTLIQGEPGGNAGLIAEEGTASLASEEEWEAACPGSAAEPSAEPGFLCVYLASIGGFGGIDLSSELSMYEAAHEFGVNVPMHLVGSTEELFVKGSWAVTAE